MTCIPFAGGIVCVTPTINIGRLKLGNWYVYVDFHPYCGPAFYWDQNGQKVYDPKDENDPIWPLFMDWMKKRDKKIADAAARKLKEKLKKGKP